MSEQGPSSKANAQGDPTGDGQPHEKPEKQERAVKAARVATTVATQRLGRRRKPSGRWDWVQNLFGGDNHLWNILAMVVASLLVIMLIALIGAIILKEKDFFIETAKPISALIATIIAFLVGQRTGPR